MLVLVPVLERVLMEVRASASASVRVGAGVVLGGRVVGVAAGAGASAGGMDVGWRTVVGGARHTCVREKDGVRVCGCY